MPLKYYYDFISQPCRAVYIFLKATNIPFQAKPVALRKGQQKQPEYRKINPLGIVPAIDDNGFILTESVAILKYLADKYDSNDSWYPKNLQQRARVDEYCAWQHMNTRFKCATLFFSDIILHRPAEELDSLASNVDTMLHEFDEVFLKEKRFLIGQRNNEVLVLLTVAAMAGKNREGDQITIADLLAACEIMQVASTGRDMLSGHKRVQSWMDRVQSATNPHFDETHAIIYRLRQRQVKPKL